MKAIIVLSNDPPAFNGPQTDEDRLLEFLTMWPLEDVVVLTTPGTSPRILSILASHKELVPDLQIDTYADWIMCADLDLSQEAE